MTNVFLKVKEFLKTYKKRILIVVGFTMLTIIIVVGGVGILKYSHAKSNIKYSQDQLKKIALAKVPGEVVNIEKELNFRHGNFEYEFKIKDKNNMLQVVKVDSQYGVILEKNRGNHMKGHHMKKNNMNENKDKHYKYNEGHGEE